jgi:hypothetical protein
MKFGALVHNVIHRREGKVDGHQLSHRSQTSDGRANGSTNNGCL